MSSEAAARLAATIERRVGPLLAPLIPSPCGIDARFEPAHEDVRNEVAKLDSPGASPVNWSRVALRGDELLTSTSKDIVIASYVAHALYEVEGLEGLAIALRLINELMERYWEPMFPPPARMRARSAAVGWWLEKTGARLTARAATGVAPSAELMTLLDAEAARLAGALRARMGDASPAVGPLQDGLERLRLAVSTAPATEPAIAQPAALEPAPATPATAVASPAPHDTAAPPSAAPPLPAAHDEALSVRAAQWLKPIRPDAPAGDDARYDDGYARIREAMKRLDMPSAQVVDWQQVLREGGQLLEGRSKDLLIAAHFAYALYEIHKLDGLITGLCVVSGLMEAFWEELHPDQRRGTRARGNALAWLLARLERLGEHPLSAADAQLLPQLELAVTRLEAQADKLGENRPAFTPLRGALTRLGFAAQALAQAQQAAPASSSPASPSPASEPGPTTPQAPPTDKPPSPSPPAASVSVAVPASAGPVPTVSNKAELNTFFARLRGQLWDLAIALRSASDRDPLAYRLSRIASYFTLVEPLPHKERVTELLPPSPFVAGEVEAIASKQSWDKLLATAEDSLRKSPYLLDLHRHVHTALARLGDGYRPAQLAVEAELLSLLRRVPELPELKFQDGSPFANDATRSLLAGLSQGAAQASGAHGPKDELPLEELDAARELVAAGRTDQALDAFNAVLSRIGQGRDRFHARLTMARACASGGSEAMAVALFEGLVADLDRHHLDEWEPSLASDCLAGYHQCLRSLAPRDKEMAQAAAVVYRRLCRVDPKRALSEGLRG